MRFAILLLPALVAACAAAKPSDFSPIPNAPPPSLGREVAHAYCLPQAEIAGEQAAMMQQSMQGGYVAIGRPAFVAGAAAGHAIGSAIAIGAARARARDLALNACMVQHGYVKTGPSK